MSLTNTATVTSDILTPIKGSETNSFTVKTPWQVKLARTYFNSFGRLVPELAARQALQLFAKPRTRYSTSRYDKLLIHAEEFQVFSDGNRINGRLWDNQGPTVLLVHGWETSGLHLGSFIEPLRNSGYRILTFDGPAHGTSQGSVTNLLHFSRAMCEVIREMGPVQHIVSHSFGGFASVYMASQFPEDLPFESMVLISIPNKLTRVIGEFARLLALPLSVVNEMDRQIKEYFKCEPEEIESGKLGRLMNVERILVIHDRHDQVLPFHNGLEIVYDLPNAYLLETENLGHNRLLRDPQVISRVAKFINL